MPSAVTAALSLLLLVCAPACGATPQPAARATLAGPPRADAPAPGDERFRGEVRERLPAGPYTYLHVDTASGPRWVVTMGAAPDGAIEVRNMGTQKNFHARRLGRDFDELVFGIVTAAPATASQI